MINFDSEIIDNEIEVPVIDELSIHAGTTIDEEEEEDERKEKEFGKASQESIDLYEPQIPILSELGRKNQDTQFSAFSTFSDFSDNEVEVPIYDELNEHAGTTSKDHNKEDNVHYEADTSWSELQLIGINENLEQSTLIKHEEIKEESGLNQNSLHSTNSMLVEVVQHDLDAARPTVIPLKYSRNGLYWCNQSSYKTSRPTALKKDHSGVEFKVDESPLAMYSEDEVKIEKIYIPFYRGWARW